MTREPPNAEAKMWYDAGRDDMWRACKNEGSKTCESCQWRYNPAADGTPIYNNGKAPCRRPGAERRVLGVFRMAPNVEHYSTCPEWMTRKAPPKPG